MRLCVPVRVPNGLESCIEPHLPNAEHLLFFDTDTRDIRHVALLEHQEGGAEAPQFDVVLCGSVNKTTKDALAERGIIALGTEAQTAGEAIAEFEAANLAAAPTGNSGLHNQDLEHSIRCRGGCARLKQGQKTEGCDACDLQEDAIPGKMRSGVLRIAVSSQNRKTVSDHAGRCRKFWVYEIRGNKVDNKSLRELTLEQTLHSSRLGDGHPLDDVHVMITAELSPFLYQRLQQGGIRPFVTDEALPDRAVQMLLEKVAQL
jgi:predicted Fe-Mo cluster-binding NifX family protein